jgi:hypothetical protein
VLFHVVESTYNPLTVTAEVASSSLVVGGGPQSQDHFSAAIS